MKKIIVAVLIAVGALSIHNTSEAMYYYLWCNTDRAYWLDGDSIQTNESKTKASGNILVEDMHTREVSKLSNTPCIIYKKDNSYYVSIEGQLEDMPVESYGTECWQPWVYKWMIECNILQTK